MIIFLHVQIAACAEPRLKAALANFEQRVIERAKARAGLDAFDRIESYWNAYLPNHRFLDANVQDHLREHILASTKDRTQFFLKRLTGLLRKRDNVMTQPALVFPFDFSHPYMSTSPPPPSSYGRWNEFANVYCVNGLQFIEKVGFSCSLYEPIYFSKVNEIWSRAFDRFFNIF